MKIPTTASYIFSSLLLFCAHIIHAQSLSFTKPVRFLGDAKTDKAFDITIFKEAHFVTWKDAGGTGQIHVCYLGKKYDTTFLKHDQLIGNEKTAFGPVLRTMGNHIYVFWIAADGSLKYIMNKSDADFDTEKTYTVKFTNPQKLTSGITAATIHDQIVIASHADDKNSMLFSFIDVDAGGILKDAVLQKIPEKSSPDFPFIVALPDTAIRISWKGKDESVLYADYNIGSKKWSHQVSVAASKSKFSPAIYSVWNSNRLFYMWRGQKNDTKIYYATRKTAVAPEKATPLPPYFSTNNAVSICMVDDKSFIMAFAGIDQHLYLSYFANYNPASWMQDMLMPTKSNYTLKDIAIPGSHDAGMSVLTAAAGQQSGTINSCNTLTQTQNIAAQLNAGIRMFDLRVGTYNRQLYTKHCSSDCMDSAIGGGYGEKLSSVSSSIKKFLQKNNKEIIILSFSHFCEKEVPLHALADSLVAEIGKEFLYEKASKELGSIPIHELAGKVIITFENYPGTDPFINSNNISATSSVFMNFRREYAATNDINKMLAKQEAFFNTMKDGVKGNDIIRLDWQLTQSADEAAMVCNDFQDDKTSVVVNGLMLLTNVARKHQSIVDLSVGGNKYLPSKINEWIANGTINKKNKPNILYVDASGSWITDFCIELNRNPIYQN